MIYGVKAVAASGHAAQTSERTRLEAATDMSEFNLWDIEGGNFIGQYAAEDSALATIKKLIDHYGGGSASDLSLGRIGDDGRVLAPLTGSELVARLGDQSRDRHLRV
jgi:hypothetical protein